MRKTLASVLLGTTLLTASCSNKSADMRSSAVKEESMSVDRPYDTTTAQNVASGSAYAGAGVASPAPQMYDKAKLADGKEGGEAYHDWGKNPWIDASKDHLSTFAADVDTASYSIARRKLEEGALPPQAAVRVEEFVNYFKYSFPQPSGNSPFSVVMEAAPSPMQAGRTIVRVGVATKAKSTMERKPAHLVFLVDVSGSMDSPDKLGLAKQALEILTRGLKEEDSVSLVTYAGSTRVVLEPTNNHDEIIAALDDLKAAGSTGMASGIDLAYRMAMQNMKPNTINRVVILSDGDANVGPHTHDEMLKLISGRAKEGVTLSTIGFGTGNYKDELMEQLADKGNGNNFYIDSMDQAKRVFQQDLTANLEVVAKDVKLQVDFDKDIVARYRLVGYENRDVKDDDFRDDKVDAGEIGAGHQVTALYEVELTAKGKQAHAPIGAIRIRHKAPDGEKATEAAFPMVGGPAASFANSSADFRFAFAAAAFADVLRGGQDAEHWSLASIRDMAKNAAGDNADRKELVTLIEKAMQISGRTASR
ncbi:MAG TPA: von Willebrand factor type A domain-containing protein [Kofleriaceae bacterium]|nr:von Willebrand factor type A domain-containing protein [Kofleriaceae bacterium]